MANPSPDAALDRGPVLIAVVLAAVKLVIHLALAGRYGFNGDELYFIACGRHLAFGYVDHAPLVPWIARASIALLGGHLFALRIPSALAGASAIVLTVLIVREWGGGAFAQLLAGLSMLIPPAYLRMGSILCIPVFEPVYWTTCAYLIVRILRDHRPRLWLLVGVGAGVGLLNKHTMLFFCLAVLVGLLATSPRQLLSRWLWLGALAAALIFLPNLLWQHRHGWPTVEFIHNIGEDQLKAIPRSLFLLGQVLYMHPFTLPITFAGLWFFYSPAGASYRIFGWIFLVVLGLLLVTHGKPYYLAPAYPPLFAGGAVWFERQILSTRWRRVVLGVCVLGGVMLAPFSLPVLPLPVTDQLIGRVLGGIVRPSDLTLELHEQYGWPEQAEAVARAYRALPDEQKRAASILTHDYTQASAINFFGPAQGLPRAVSGHMTYWLWGPEPDRGRTVLAYGFPDSALRRWFSDVDAVGTISHPLASEWQTGLPIYLCTQPRMPLVQAWPEMKRYRFRD